MNGMISCPLGDDGVLSFEDTCTLTCAMGYMVNGAAMRTCQSDGTFNGTEANCSRSKKIVQYDSYGIVGTTKDRHGP